MHFVKHAFLNVTIDCESFVQQSKEYKQFSKNKERLVRKLNKSLYGLKQEWKELEFLICLKKTDFNDHQLRCMYIFQG